MDFVADSLIVFAKLFIDVVGYLKVKVQINKFMKEVFSVDKDSS